MSGLTKIELEFCEIVPHALTELVTQIKGLRGDLQGKQKSTGAPKGKTPPYKCLDVTQVEVYPLYKRTDGGTLKAYASVILNDHLCVKGLRVLESSETGLYVGYPPNPYGHGEEFDAIIYPTSKELRQHIENCVLEKYMAVTK